MDLLAGHKLGFFFRFADRLRGAAARQRFQVAAEDDESDHRAQDKSHPESCADQTQPLGTSALIGAVRNGGLRGGNIRAGQAVDDA